MQPPRAASFTTTKNKLSKLSANAICQIIFKRGYEGAGFVTDPWYSPAGVESPTLISRKPIWSAAPPRRFCALNTPTNDRLALL
jgi:hypothetical protein